MGGGGCRAVLTTVNLLCGYKGWGVMLLSREIEQC